MALITELDDRTLVELHRAGDDDAFRRIVQRHHRSLYANAMRRLGDPVLAEDAVQDAFLRAFRNLDRFDGDYHLDAWLHRILTNTCHDIGRRRGRDVRLFDRACTEVEVEAPAADDELETMPRDQLHDALDALPESYREVLLLRFVDEMSYSDVAIKAGITEQNARARVSRGRNMLKRMLSSTSALLVWAIPPLRRQAQLSGAEAEAANQAAAQVHGLATIAATAPAPTQAFSQVSGIIAQAGPAIATAAPAVSSTAPAFKAAMAVGIAASMAIPAGVAVDRARQQPTAPTATEVEDESSTVAADAPIVVESAGEVETAAVPSSTTEPVQALAAGGASGIEDIASDTTTTSAPTTTVAPSSETTTSTSSPPPTGEGDAPPPAPAPGPIEEEHPPPAPAPATPGQLSAAVTVTPVASSLHLDGDVNLQVGEEIFTGTLSGKLYIAEADAKSQGEREVYRSELTVHLDDGRVLELVVYGWSTVTQHGNGETHALRLTFMLQAPPELGLAEGGSLEGTLVLRHGSGDLGLAIPGATQDT